MILISHRGNINGKIEELENSPQYIIDSVKSGFDVEIDLWQINGNFYLGHDDPKYKIDFSFLETYKDRLWIHCKNMFAFIKLFEFENKFRFFFHEYEKFILTNRGDIIVHGQTNRFPKNSIYMMPEELNIKKEYLQDCKGICSDFIINYVYE